MNWKYKGETALRQSGLDYTIIRATGLVNRPDPTKMGELDADSKRGAEMLATPCKLEAFQGDVLSGRITRGTVGFFLTNCMNYYLTWS